MEKRLYVVEAGVERRSGEEKERSWDKVIQEKERIVAGNRIRLALWNIKTKHLLCEKFLDNWLVDYSYKYDDQLLGTCDQKGIVQIWDLRTENEGRKVTIPGDDRYSCASFDNSLNEVAVLNQMGNIIKMVSLQ